MKKRGSSSLSFHFNLRTEAIVTAPPRESPSPGKYHWQKMENFCDAKKLEKELRADKRFIFRQTLIDHEKDTVGYCFETPNMAQFKNAVKKTLGKNHRLTVFEVSSCRHTRQQEIEKMRNHSC